MLNVCLILISFQIIKLDFSSPKDSSRPAVIFSTAVVHMYHAVPFCPYEHQSNEPISQPFIPPKKKKE